MSEAYSYHTTSLERIRIEPAKHGVYIWIADDSNRFRAITLPASERQAAAQALAGDEYRAVPARAATVDPDSLDLMHVDLGRILDALGLPVIARPYSPHECVTRDVLPAIEQMMDDAYRWRCSETLQDARDAEVQAAQPDRPEPVDPASVPHVDEARGDELRRAAEDLYGDNGPEPGSVATWLRERADRIWPDRQKVDAMRQMIRDVILANEPDAEDDLDDPEIAQLAHGLVLRGVAVPDAD